MKKIVKVKKWRIAIILIVLAIVIAVFAAGGGSDAPGRTSRTAGELFAAADISAAGDDRYVGYIAQYEKAFHGSRIALDMGERLETEDTSFRSMESFEGREALVTEEQGSVSWEISVEQAGLYAISVEYYTVEGNGGNIERNIYIDGEIPFKEAEGVEFSRVYVDDEPNASGKTVRPGQVEQPSWRSGYVTDSFGYWSPALYFYLEKGTHTLTLESVKEPMAIGAITLVSENVEPEAYERVLEAHRAAGAAEAAGALEGGISLIQAENTLEKSSPTLGARSDTSSTKNQPYSYSEKLLNVVGGESWQYSNQWITWEFAVPKSGLYRLGARVKQNFAQDIYFNRSLYIDGELPFQEAGDIHFFYYDDWQTFSFGDEQTEGGWLFYLEEGTHTVTLKNTVGDMVNILTEADDILTDLSAVNLDLLAVLSTTPDTDRDYQIALYMPEVLEAIAQNRDRLAAIRDAMVEMTGERASLSSQLEQLISVLDKMYKSPSKIAGNYSRFRDLLGTFGEWIITIREQPLILDYLFVAEADTEVRAANDNAVDKLVTQAMNFVTSFVSDYSMISADSGSKEESITVWIGSGLTGGRDQAMALNQMIQDSFTAETGIGVNLQLVPANTLLSATLAGRGPDIALQVAQTEPVDFALRNAAYDLTGFEDFDEIASRFAASALEPFTYDGGVYAMPETMSFPMLFYRTDIMEELGIDVSALASWDSIIEILAVLQTQNMNFALPATMQSYSMFLYQMGGEYYTPDQTASALGERISLDAFEYWTNFYQLYGMDVDFSFENRFRTGEMPIGIAEYTTYNLLSISAPEIKGKWAMIELPGLRTADGEIRNIAPLTVQGCMMLESCDNKPAAWEFVKWWSSAEVQYEFGEQLEAVMGAAARYNTANLEALLRFSWAGRDRRSIEAQTKKLRGVPQVPGGYFTERNLNFAKLAVINDDENPREALLERSEDITEEITMKRQEFGLSTAR